MSLITTDSGRVIMKKAESMMAVPYVNNSTYGWVLGSDVYDLSAIIGDSTTIEQEEGEKTTKSNEFVASPLLECFSGAKYNFTAQCLDLQNNVLKACFNVMTSSSAEGVSVFSDDHVPLYALFRIRFSDSGLPDVILPKVQLNSKLLINQLKTRASQGNIAGTALSTYVAFYRQLSATASQFSVLSTGVSTYLPFTPVFFVPKGKATYIFHHWDSSSIAAMSSVNFTTGTVTDVAIKVYKTNGTIVIPSGGGGEGGGSGEGGDDPNSGGNA